MTGEQIVFKRLSYAVSGMVFFAVVQVLNGLSVADPIFSGGGDAIPGGVNL